jgi:hypothetical protein
MERSFAGRCRMTVHVLRPLVVIAFEPETRDVSERGTKAFRGAKSLSRHVRVQPGGVGRMRRSRCQ